MEGEGVPSDPTVRAAARAVDQGLREAEALHTAGHDAESLVVATQALADAERVGFAPLRARALLTRARAEEGKGDFATAERTYRDASIAAEAAGAWATAARALCGAAWRAADRGDYDRAEEQFDHAAVWVQRFGDDDELRGELELARGRELGERGKYAEARALGEKALERFERKGSDHAIEAVAELGIVADYEGRKSDARALYGRVLAWDERVLGAGSSKAARVLENLGMLEQDEGDFDAALRDESRAVAILNATLGPDHPATGVALSNLADWLERPAEALPLAQRALAIAEKATGASADTGYALLALGGALRGLGRDEEVIGPSERALAIFQREQRPLAVADAQANLGLALHATRRDEPRARALLLRARETLVAEGRRERLAEIDKALGTTKR
jgi:serine/threonine-protein kinase